MITTIFLCAFLAADSAPKTYVLNTAENVWDVTVEDINGDKFRDVFVLTCDETSHPLKKAVCGYIADAEGVYPAAPTVSLPLDPSIGALFFAEVDGAPPRELIVTDGMGATVYRFTATGFEVMDRPRFSSLLPTGCKEPVFLKDGAIDLDGDHIDEWLIPVPTGFELRHVNGPVATLPGDVVSEVRRVNGTYIMHQLPAYYPFTMQGASAKALAFCSDEFADFSYGDGWAQHQRFRIPLNVKEKWEASAKMADINNDGFPDLAVTQTRGTVHLEALSHIYVASAPFTYPDTPTATYVNKGAIATPELIDVDGDKRLDVVLISVPLGLRNFINFFLRGKLSVDVQVYLFNGKDFGAEPAFETALTMDAPEGREQVAYTMGDFNGDGRMDVAFGQANDVLAIFTGEPGRFVSAKPWVALTLPSFGLARPFDLNGNAAKDIVMFHPSGKNSKRVEVIVF